jgi:hypothetical protein
MYVPKHVSRFHIDDYVFHIQQLEYVSNEGRDRFSEVDMGNNVKNILTEIECKVVDWIQLAHCIVQQ